MATRWYALFINIVSSELLVAVIIESAADTMLNFLSKIVFYICLLKKKIVAAFTGNGSVKLKCCSNIVQLNSTKILSTC